MTHITTYDTNRYQCRNGSSYTSIKGHMFSLSFFDYIRDKTQEIKWYTILFQTIKIKPV